MAAITLDELYEFFEFIDDWEERYGYIIDLGRKLPVLDDEYKVEANKVHGCTSQVWLIHKISDSAPPTIDLTADSDALIVKGLIAILMTLYSGKTPAEILETDAKTVFERLGLERHLSPNRRSGFFSMVGRVKELAVAHA
jgi:cysteine desulfuration protein SufE